MAEAGLADTPAQKAARDFLHGYGIRTEAYTRQGGDHPMMMTLPAAFEAFAKRPAAAPSDAEVEVAANRSATLLVAAADAIEEHGWGMDFSHVDGIETDHIGFAIDCRNAVERLRAALSTRPSPPGKSQND